MARIQTAFGRRNDLSEALKRTCVVLISQGIDAGVPAERETSLETWAQLLWQIADTFDTQADPAPDTHLLVQALREWSHAARRSLEADAIGQTGFDNHMLAHVNALGAWETRRIAAQVTAASI